VADLITTTVIEATAFMNRVADPRRARVVDVADLITTTVIEATAFMNRVADPRRAVVWQFLIQNNWLQECPQDGTA